ncbi:MAG: acetyl-CoA hydrolase/transferase family protein [Streptosporangiaceae bacterium]|jgi:succinyl-CoA:acetate CoA-transferase
MTGPNRIQPAHFRRKIMDAEDAAALIPAGANVGMSGFTGAGHPKAVPAALAARVKSETSVGRRFRVGVWTGASTAPDLDGVLAQVDGIELLLPYQGDPVTRREVNSGRADYIDMHLSGVAQLAGQGLLGPLDFAVIEAVGVTGNGDLIPSTSVGNNKTWIDLADKVIVEINAGQSAELDGFHDIYYGTAKPPDRMPIPITAPGDRIGVPHLVCPADKIAAIVLTDAPDWSTPFKPPDPVSETIAGHVIDFLSAEVASGRLPRDLLPLQSGVGNVANAVLGGLGSGPFERLTAYTEVIQDGMLQLLESEKLLVASATAFTLSQQASDRLTSRLPDYRRKVVLRPQEISNHPEVIRRLGCLAMNAMLEADIYGNVNSSHVMATAMQNGIGGSGDFTRNAYISIFVSPSQAKGGTISCIVPMVSHVDHTEHDVSVIITEQGVADLRGLAPKRRARKIIDNCAHPDFRPALGDYFERALATSRGKHTPHLLSEALSWHERYLSDGTMRQDSPGRPGSEPGGYVPG